jgi:ATPase subunit of ABC transporter with duplicated ATPase domains
MTEDPNLKHLYGAETYAAILKKDAEAEALYQERRKKTQEKQAKAAEYERQVRAKQAAFRKTMQKKRLEEAVSKVVEADIKQSTSEGFQSHVAFPQPQPVEGGEQPSGQNADQSNG